VVERELLFQDFRFTFVSIYSFDGEKH